MPRFIKQQKIRKEWSPNLAYAIGLITSDGNLSLDRRHISFKSVDKELVENFRHALGIKNKIGKSGRGYTKVKNYFHVCCGDVVFYRFLNKIGIYSKKSKTIKKVQMPKRFFDDFLRGLFDGDGTFYTFWDKRWPNSFGYQTAFSSASPDFINWLKLKLSEIYGVKGFIRKGDYVFNLRYVKGDSRKLFRKMYHKKDILFLKRKYDKIIKALKLDEKLKSARYNKPE